MASTNIGGRWKPIQTGMKIVTYSFIELAKHFLSEGFEYVLPARFNQDCLESLFSTLRRHGNQDPNALQAMRSLRIITMSQFIDSRKEKFNYEKDEDTHWVSLISSKTVSMKTELNEIEKCVTFYNYELRKENLPPITNSISKNSINHFLGGAIYKIFKKHKICKGCRANIVTKRNKNEENVFTYNLDENSLVYPNSVFFTKMLEVDPIIDIEFESCKTHPHLQDHIFSVIKKNIQFGKYECTNCNFVNLFLKYYVFLKQIALIKNVKNSQRNEKFKRFASRSTNRFSDKH